MREKASIIVSSPLKMIDDTECSECNYPSDWLEIPAHYLPLATVDSIIWSSDAAGLNNT